MICKKCNLKYRGVIPPKCVKCGEPLENGAVIHEPTPVNRWPKWVKWLESRKEPGEIGVGDTFQRLAAKIGGEFFKSTIRKLGIDCSCERRQQDLNAMYPYTLEENNAQHHRSS